MSRRITVVELDDEEVALVRAGLDKLTAADGNVYVQGIARSKLLPTAQPAVTLTALRLIAEGSDHAGEIAREALEQVGDRVSSDAPEGPPEDGVTIAPQTGFVSDSGWQARSDAQGGGEE